MWIIKSKEKLMNYRVLKNAKLFAKVLSDKGIKACLVNEEYFPAQQVIIKWDHPEGARSACCRLAKAGIYAKAIRLEDDRGIGTGLHFSLTGLTRLGIEEEDLILMAVKTADVLLFN